MAQRNWFDDLSRIAASKLPRRQALKLIAGVVAGAVLPGFLQGRARASSVMNAHDILATPVENFTEVNADVIYILQKLQRKYNTPFSFIQADLDNPTSINVAHGTVQDVLDQVLAHNPMYRLTEVNGRLVLLHDIPILNKVVEDISIKNLPRLEAMDAYVTALKSKSDGFGHILGAVMFGDPDHPVASNPVTLSAKASVLQHFVELLGDSSTAFFSLHKAPNGYLFWLGNTKARPQIAVAAMAAAAVPAAATCRPLGITEVGAGAANCGAAQQGCGQAVTYTKIVLCPGDDCTGQSVEEDITKNVDSCNLNPAIFVSIRCGVTDAAGDILGVPDGAVCTDTLRMCFPGGTIPMGGCCDISLQQLLYVGSTLVRTCTDSFHMCNPPVAGCFSRSCSDTNTTDACCNNSGGGPIVCPAGPPPQVCVNGNTCCPKPRACKNKTVCCLSNEVCINDNKCCPTGVTTVCNNTCCPVGNYVCVNNACCAAAQACKNKTVCCKPNETCVGGNTCCPTGVTTVCNNTCCPVGNYVCINNACCATAQSCNGTCCQATETCVNGMCCSDDQEC